LNSSAKGSS
jgi:hypothetical protein